MNYLEQPKTTKDNVVLPEKLEHWLISEEMLYYVYYNFIRKNISKMKKQKISGQTQIMWIDQILSRIFKDGRKRLIDLVILPYLINIKGLNVDDAVQMCFEWALKNHQTAPIKIDNKSISEPHLFRYIQYKAKYVKQRGLKPLKKENISLWFPEKDLKILG